MTGDQWQGVAAFVLAIGSLAGTVGTLVMQFRNSRVSRDTNAKVTEVHEATRAIADATGTHTTLSSPDGEGHGGT